MIGLARVAAWAQGSSGGTQVTERDRRQITLSMVAAVSLPPLPRNAVEQVSASRSHRGRVVIDVRINEQGPFRFVVDSAANASVISADRAEALALPTLGALAVNTLLGREAMPGVLAAHLKAGALSARDVTLAVGSALGLDGADGLIGADLLRGLRLDLRFTGPQRARLTRSRRSDRSFFDAERPTVAILPARDRRFDGMIALGATVDGAEVLAIVDTGASVSVANRALVRAAAATPLRLRDGSDQGRVQSPSGRSAPALAMSLARLNIGRIVVSQVPVLVGDFHVFSLWGAADRPAMLLGADVLFRFRAVAIDLRRGEVTFEA